MKPAAKVGQCRVGAAGQSGQASLAENSPGAGSKPDSRGLGILSEGSIATPRDRSVCIVFGPAFVSCMTSLLRWPNTQQGKHLVVGYPIVGEVAPSGVFRPISQPSKLPVDAWLGPPAEEAVDRILRTSRPRT